MHRATGGVVCYSLSVQLLRLGRVAPALTSLSSNQSFSPVGSTKLSYDHQAVAALRAALRAAAGLGVFCNTPPGSPGRIIFGLGCRR